MCRLGTRLERLEAKNILKVLISIPAISEAKSSLLIVLGDKRFFVSKLHAGHFSLVVEQCDGVFFPLGFEGRPEDVVEWMFVYVLYDCFYILFYFCSSYGKRSESDRIEVCGDFTCIFCFENILNCLQSVVFAGSHVVFHDEKPGMSRESLLAQC